MSSKSVITKIGSPRSCPHCDALLIELAHARAEQEDLKEEVLVRRAGWTKAASERDQLWDERNALLVGLAACRDALRELVEGAIGREQSLLANFNAERSPRLNERWRKALTEARALLARAEEERKRDG